MKKSIFGLLVCFALCMTQNASAQLLTMGGSGGAIANTLTGNNSLRIAEAYTNISIQTVVTKVSGTVAGTITLQGSNDGANFITMPTAIVSGGTVTFSPTDVASQSAIFIVIGAPYLWYRVSYVGTGTMNALMSSYLLPKK